MISSFPEDADIDIVSAELIRDLQCLGVVGRAKVIDSVFYRLQSFSCSRAFCNEVTADTKGMVKMHVVDSLAQCMSDEADEWQRALD